jgi:2-polyprenyl-3-methyl-5-hydroxy-6-metoxy-1,4-benzoquinol methylase
MSDTIIEYYSNYDEKNRILIRHSLERIRTQEIINRYLDLNKKKIIDIGGAAGVYSFWLAELGHSVELIDITPIHIDQAKEHQVESGIKLNSIMVGDALNLPFKNEIFDVALLMGPMYHLLNKDRRIQALNEASRVIQKNGIVFISAISRYASMFDGFLEDFIKDDEFYKIVYRDIETGKHINHTNNPNYFIDSYFHHPNELENEIVESGLRLIDMYAVEGLGNYIPNIEERMKDDSYRNKLMEILRMTEKEPSIMGISNHFLCVAGKK